MELLSRKIKADFESGLSSLLINEKISSKHCLCSMDDEKETALKLQLHDAIYRLRLY